MFSPEQQLYFIFGALVYIVIMLTVLLMRSKRSNKVLVIEVAKYQVLLGQKLKAIEQNQSDMGDDISRVKGTMEDFSSFATSSQEDAANVQIKLDSLGEDTQSLLDWRREVKDTS